MADTLQCPNCGVENETDRTRCSNCQNPLTAYGGELTGETYIGKLAEQADLVTERPHSVVALVALVVLYVLLGPLRTTYLTFAHRVVTNAEGTNYVGASFGIIGPIMIAAFQIPYAIALLVAGGGAMAQKTWGWNAGIVVLALSSVSTIRGFMPFPGILYVAVIITVAVLWFSDRTKAWFGLT